VDDGDGGHGFCFWLYGYVCVLRVDEVEMVILELGGGSRCLHVVVGTNVRVAVFAAPRNR
jgi:hypothetical protein